MDDDDDAKKELRMLGYRLPYDVERGETFASAVHTVCQTYIDSGLHAEDFAFCLCLSMIMHYKMHQPTKSREKFMAWMMSNLTSMWDDVEVAGYSDRHVTEGTETKQ